MCAANTNYKILVKVNQQTFGLPQGWMGVAQLATAFTHLWLPKVVPHNVGFGGDSFQGEAYLF